MQRLACTCQQDLLGGFTFNILLSRFTADISMSHSYHNNKTNVLAYFKTEISHCTAQQSIKNRGTYTLPDTLLVTPHWLHLTYWVQVCFCCQIHVVMLFAQNSHVTTKCCSISRDLSDQSTFFQSSVVELWLACVNCSIGFLLLADRSGLLLQGLKYSVLRNAYN